MIDDALALLKNQLNEHMNHLLGNGTQDRVVFLEGSKIDPISFQTGTVTVLLIGLEQENSLRAADPYRRTRRDGTVASVQPDLHLNLYVLFVVHFSQYEQSLKALSLVLKYFNRHRVMHQDNTPSLPKEIDRLTLEVVTLPFSEQSEIWSALRTTYHPSVLYRVRMLTFADEPTDSLTQILETSLDLRQPQEGPPTEEDQI